MSKALYESVIKTAGRKGIGFGVNYINPKVPIPQQVIPKKPFLFLKHFFCITHNPKEVTFRNHDAVNHEVELGFIVSKTGKNIPKEHAMQYVGGYFLLFDFTYSSIGEGRKNGVSWCLYKNAEEFWPVSDFVEKSAVKDPHNIDLELKINGKVKQAGNTGEMIFKIPELIEFTSKHFALNEGDLFLTGTPPGIDKLNDGDVLEAKMSEENQLLASLNLKVNYSKH
jgi:acylpyruvate hydrolase